MGSITSQLSTEAIVALLLASGAVGYALAQRQPPAAAAPSSSSTSASSASGKRGGKKRKPLSSALDSAPSPIDSAAAAPPVVVAFPDVVPGGFDAPAAAAAAASEREDTLAPPTGGAKKPKKKKAKKATLAPGEQSDAASSSAAGPSQPPAATERSEAWTRVETRRKGGKGADTLAPLGSDVGITTSVTGTSSPATAETEDEGVDENAAKRPEETRRPLAERLLPKARKTGVDDMLETPDYPSVSRVMRVQPATDERPATGFSWGDYEDVRTGNEADGEGDDGWGVVKSKRPNASRSTGGGEAKPPTVSAAETKKQRQNAAKRDAQKAEKAEAEAERLAKLARHKRDIERAKIAESYAKSGKGSKAPTGTASVTESGKLVWD